MTAVETSIARVSAAGERRLPATAVVLGARNLGGSIARDLLAHEVRVASIARTPADLDVLGEAGAMPVPADASEPGDLARALALAAGEIGGVELIVNAVSAVRPPPDGSGFGGGPIAKATPAGFDGWVVPAARQAFVFLSEGARVLEGRGGTLIQVLGSPARRPDPQRGLVAAAQAAVRAMCHAAAQELRDEGIHVAVLIVDGVIQSPKTERMTESMPEEALARMEDVAEAVRYLSSQAPRAWSHELVLTPAGARWLP